MEHIPRDNVTYKGKNKRRKDGGKLIIPPRTTARQMNYSCKHHPRKRLSRTQENKYKMFG